MLRRFPAYLLCLVTLSLALSCRKGSSVSYGSSDICTVEFGVKSSVGSPSTFNSIDLFVFRKETGVLESHVRSASSPVSINVIQGVELDYVVYANAPEGAFDEVADKKQLSGLVSSLADNADGFDVMRGEGTAVFTSERTVTVTLVRFMHRVLIESIVPSFLTPILISQGFTIDAIYLINVYGSCSYEGKPAGDVWYNKLGWDSGLPHSLNDLLRRDINHRMTDNSAYVIPSDRNALYCYPNPYDNGVTSKESPSWSERNTRLVVETTLGSTKYYYPVTLPKLEGNDCYHITRLSLLGIGSDHPDKLVDRVEISYFISLESWDRSEEDIVMKTEDI